MELEFDETIMGEHGFDDNTRVPCRRTTANSIITCPSCLETDQATMFAKISPEERRSCTELLERLNSAGRYGLSYETFKSSTSEAISAARMLTSAEKPLCYWVGYNHPVLVSWRHVRDWTVSIPSPKPKLIFPRRWINIKGERIEEIWNAALRAVIGTLIIRPGISLVRCNLY
jgi:transcription factor C subunit 3